MTYHHNSHFLSGEYHLPKRTQLWPNLDKLFHDERCWENPNKFDATRFLSADGKFTGIHPSFKPFGTGRRVYVGESLALSELIVLSCIGGANPASYWFMALR